VIASDPGRDRTYGKGDTVRVISLENVKMSPNGD